MKKQIYFSRKPFLAVATLSFLVALSTVAAWSFSADQKVSPAKNARLALGSVRMFSNVLVDHVRQSAGYPPSLVELLASPDSRGKELLRSADLVKKGYRFHYRANPPGPAGKIDGFTLVAWPLDHGKTGTVAFFTNQSGIIRWTREARMPTVDDEPIDTLSLR